jgi:hypothetical protein
MPASRARLSALHALAVIPTTNIVRRRNYVNSMVHSLAGHIASLHFAALKEKVVE